MDSKTLLYAIIGFLLGGLIVSIAATIEQNHVLTDSMHTLLGKG